MRNAIQVPFQVFPSQQQTIGERRTLQGQGLILAVIARITPFRARPRQPLATAGKKNRRMEGNVPARRENLTDVLVPDLGKAKWD